MARFWDEAMDWILHQVTGDHAVLRSAKGVGPYLRFRRTPDMKTVKKRVHLDLRPYPGDDQAAEVVRLRALGATDIDLGQVRPVDVPGRPGGQRVRRPHPALKRGLFPIWQLR
jgi:Glyoxalase-like domain